MDRDIRFHQKILYAPIGSEVAPTLVDVRRDAGFAIAEVSVAGVFHVPRIRLTGIGTIQAFARP